MELSIILTTVLNIFATSPDLCADVYADASGVPYSDALGQTLSRYCKWAAPNAPVLDANVCCAIDGDDARCTLPDSNDRCRQGAKMHCEYGERTRAGVICYQPLTSVCDLGFCAGGVAQPGSGPLEDTLCCWDGGGCTEVETVAHIVGCADGGGYLGFCIDGALNEDGTVDCFDF